MFSDAFYKPIKPPLDTSEYHRPLSQFTAMEESAAGVIQRALKVRDSIRKKKALQYIHSSKQLDTLVQCQKGKKRMERHEAKNMFDHFVKMCKCRHPLLLTLWQNAFPKQFCNGSRFGRIGRILTIVNTHTYRCFLRDTIHNGNLFNEYYSGNSLDVVLSENITQMDDLLTNYALAISTDSTQTRRWIMNSENGVALKLENVFHVVNQWDIYDVNNLFMMELQTIKGISELISVINLCMRSSNYFTMHNPERSTHRMGRIVNQMEWIRWELQECIYTTQPAWKPVNGEHSDHFKRFCTTHSPLNEKYFVLHAPTSPRPELPKTQTSVPFVLMIEPHLPTFRIEKLIEKLKQLMKQHFKEKGYDSVKEMYSQEKDPRILCDMMESWNRINIISFCVDLDKAYCQLVTTTLPGSTMLQKILCHFQQECCYMVDIMRRIDGRTKYRYCMPSTSECKSICIERGFMIQEGNQQKFHNSHTHCKSYDNVLECINKIRKCMQQLRFRLQTVGILRTYLQYPDFEQFLTENCRSDLLSYREKGRCCKLDDYTKAMEEFKNASGHDKSLAYIIKKIMLSLLEQSQHLKHNLQVCLLRKEIDAELVRLQ